jgi:CheY-like chemotaxis protein
MANQTIFVTNDDQTYVEMIRDLLIDVGYPGVLWNVGGGAFHKIRDTQPALVLLDINLVNPGRGWNTLDVLSLHPKTPPETA